MPYRPAKGSLRLQEEKPAVVNPGQVVNHGQLLIMLLHAAGFVKKSRPAGWYGN